MKNKLPGKPAFVSRTKMSELQTHRCISRAFLTSRECAGKTQFTHMKLPKINCPHCAEAIPPEFVFESVARIIKAARLPHAAQAPRLAHHLNQASTRRNATKKRSVGAGGAK
jgi:hypothetical protein